MFEPELAGRPVYRIYQWAWESLDWIFPPYCAGCGKAGARWCARCQAAMSLVEEPCCLRCGRSIAYEGVCIKCRKDPPNFHALRSVAYFEGPLRKAVHRLKYKGDLALGEILSRPIIKALRRLNWDIDLVTPVPLARERQKKRGYNQAALLARPLAISLNLVYQPKALIKIRETPTQVGLTLSERRANVRGVFQACSELVVGRKILILDDVITSGATLDACAQALSQAGAQEIYALTLTRALYAEKDRTEATGFSD